LPDIVVDVVIETVQDGSSILPASICKAIQIIMVLSYRSICHRLVIGGRNGIDWLRR
jgi:hypothetical protein